MRNSTEIREFMREIDSRMMRVEYGTVAYFHLKSVCDALAWAANVIGPTRRFRSVFLEEFDYLMEKKMQRTARGGSLESHRRPN